MARQSTVVEDPTRGIQLEVIVDGDGEDVVLVPSALRGGADFALLQRALTDAGFRSLALNPRGVGASTSPRSAVTLRDLAADIGCVVGALGRAPAHLIGHALGNIVVRATASYDPELVATVTVMPCGGHDLGTHPVPPHVLQAFARCHDGSLPESERLEALRLAFFAPGNDPSAWLEGWWPASSFPAALRTVPQQWWRGGDVPMLVVQPLEDAMAPTDAGREAASALGARATYVEIPRCGHAILPEQPNLIARHITDFLRAHPIATVDNEGRKE